MTTPHVRPRRHARVLVPALAAWLAGCGGGDGGPAAGPVAPEAPGGPLIACASLAGTGIPASRIALPIGGVSITEATDIAADAPGNPLGAYCAVRGAIHPVNANAPDILFAVNLPHAWNGKGIHFGGGGFNGRLIDGTETVRFGPSGQPAPLARGYATWGSDSGHQSSSITNGAFAADDEALANYGGLALKKTRDAALYLVQAMYGRAPDHAYFLGTSTGGRDALSHIQRWPDDYDGVIANEPALNYTGTRLSNVAVGRALYANGGAGWLNVAKTLRVQRAALDACDGLDGAQDGIVGNVEACRQLNDRVLASLRCPGGADTGDECLSDAQLTTVRTIASPLTLTRYTLADGVTRAGGYNLLEGALVAGPYTTRNLGSRPTPANPATSTDANMYVTGDQWVKFFITRDAGFDTLGFDPLDPGPYTARVTEVARITDATNPDLRPFLARGGKLIMLHGLADEVISPNSTIDYYTRVVETVGEDIAQAGIRFYTVPGMGHGTGVFIPAWDSLGALEDWVERGMAPGTPVAADTVAATYGRTRPLCAYPGWPRYQGSGSMDAAVNFQCTQEVGNALACPNLPAAPARYKGGNMRGEELTLVLDPASLRYSVVIDASLQRAAGTTLEGRLSQQDGCRYGADGGGTFVFGAGGVVQGSVAMPAGGRSPLVAFADTFDNAATPGVFNPVAAIYNAIGVHHGADGTPAGYGASGRLRNAGTFQLCLDERDGRFNTYDANCARTAKGYVRIDAARRAFDVRTTPADGGATTTGGTPSGSMVIGLVGGQAVPLLLVRDADGSHGMRLFTPQQSLITGAADGHYALAGDTGATALASWSGMAYDRAGARATLAADTPAAGVFEAGGNPGGHLLAAHGLLGFVPRAAGSPVFELGLRH